MVEVLDLVKVLFTRMGLKDRKGMYENGFFTLGGLFTGIILNDVWRLFNGPGGYENLIVGGKDTGLKLDHFYQNLIVGGIVVFSTLFNVKGGISGGSGMAIGVNYANLSEKHDYIGQY